MKKKLLVVRVNEPGPVDLSLCCVGQNRCICAPGAQLSGQEGVLWPGTKDEVSTGWNQPVGWLTLEEAVLAAEYIIDDNLDQLTDDELAEQVKATFEQRLASPDDFPGLQEHYPAVADAFDEGP